MKVRFTAGAKADFLDSVEYLLINAPAVVSGFADAIDRAVVLLLTHPHAGQEVDEAGVRRLYIGRFRHSIFYAAEGDEVIIYHIYHSSRDAWKKDK